MTDNRRHAERVPYPCEVQCTLAEGMAIANTRLSDVSTDGAFVESVNQLPVGTDLRLRFQLGGRTVEVSGRIVQSMPQFGFGVHFTQVAPEDRAALAALVAQGG
jgi:hypothetical protein